MLSQSLPPLSIYVHFPWCVRKCPYCDFNSHAVDGVFPEQAYIAQLSRDLVAEAQFYEGRTVETIFLGGGTPSLFSAEAIQTFLDDVRRSCTVAADAEITLEANPGTTDAARFAGYRAAGVNRLSIGVQSFDDAALTRLGRIHNGAAAQEAIITATAAGFSRINIDLMHGLPEQTPTESLRDLQIAAATGVEHISWYQLTIEANTEFYRSAPRLPDEDAMAAIEADGSALLQNAGFTRYEVSAWCRNDQVARHNRNYWQFGDYVALGAGAHGKQTFSRDGWQDGRPGGELQVMRYQKSRVPRDYLADCTRRNVQQIDRAALPFEFLLNALRLADGTTQALFEARTGLPIGVLEPTLSQLRSQALMRQDRLAATAEGWRYLDSLLQAFLPVLKQNRADDR